MVEWNASSAKLFPPKQIKDAGALLSGEPHYVQTIGPQVEALSLTKVGADAHLHAPKQEKILGKPAKDTVRSFWSYMSWN